MSRHILRMLLVLIICPAFILAFSFMGSAIPSLAAGPSMALSMKSGPPTTMVRINGKGFGANQSILIDFDTTQVGTSLADTTGAFIVQVQIPTTATPGNHIIQAISQNSGLSASKTFLNRLIGDYASYIQSFIQIRDPQISDYVQQKLQEGVLWLEPLIQLNPLFARRIYRSTGDAGYSAQGMRAGFSRGR